MATQNVCRYFKFGFCKYLKKCRFPHVKEICENTECDARSCSLRHPRICSYYRDYRRCKFGEWCSFKHVEKISDIEIVDRIKNLEKLIAEKDEVISILENKILVIEKRVGLESNENSEESDKKEVTSEITSETVEKFKCDLCEYESNSERGIHIHKKKKHGNIPRYPKHEKKIECDLCGEVFYSKTEVRIHKRSHSIITQVDHTKGKESVCENCGFKSKCTYTKSNTSVGFVMQHLKK